MFVTSLDKVEKSTPPMPGARGVTKQVPISAGEGTPNFCFRVFTIEPGGNTPFHSHPFEHLNYVISGKGLLMAENSQYAIQSGDFALVLPGEKHQYRNPSGNCEAMVIICAVPNDYE